MSSAAKTALLSFLKNKIRLNSDKKFINTNIVILGVVDDKKSNSLRYLILLNDVTGFVDSVK